MEDLFTDLKFYNLLSWRLKGHPFWTSFLKGYYIGLIILMILTLIRLFTSEAILATLEQDIRMTFIIGTVGSILLLTFTSINQFYFPDKK